VSKAEDFDPMEWTSARTAGVSLGTTDQGIIALAKLGKVRTLDRPGKRRLYSCEDVRKLAKEAKSRPAAAVAR
jgi:hypothetical protein